MGKGGTARQATDNNMGKGGTARQATDNNIILHMRIAYQIPKATDTHSQCALFAFPRQKWFLERALIFRSSTLPVLLNCIWKGKWTGDEEWKVRKERKVEVLDLSDGEITITDFVGRHDVVNES
jgi:hypothetical protein